MIGDVFQEQIILNIATVILINREGMNTACYFLAMQFATENSFHGE